MTIFSIALVFGISFLGCGDSEPPKETSGAEVPKPKAEPQADNSPSKKEAPEKKNVIEKKGFDPLEGKSLKEICSASGLLLIKWPYDKIQREFNTLCCAKNGLSADDYRCEMDWPFSDVPSCSAYDELRNEIFARYGRAFKSPKWQKMFGATDWYRVRADFSNDWVSDVANQNVALLVKKKQEKDSCMD